MNQAERDSQTRRQRLAGAMPRALWRGPRESARHRRRRRLREAGHAFEQEVAIRKEPDEQPLDEGSRAGDRAGDFRFDAVDGMVHRGDLFSEVLELGGDGKLESAD